MPPAARRDDDVAEAISCCTVLLPLRKLKKNDNFVIYNKARFPLPELTARETGFHYPSTRAMRARGFHKRQKIGMLGRSSGNHDWLFANTSACVSCGFRQHGPSTRLVETRPSTRPVLTGNGNRSPVNSGRSLEPPTRVVETGLK